MTIVSINPATGKTLAEYQEMPVEEVQEIIASTHDAFLNWRKTSFAQRAALMKQAASILRAKAPDYARLMTQEMGKPIRDGRAEVEKCAWVCDYYADNAELFLQPEPVTTDASKSFITYQPLGVVLAVMPWNFPFWQVFRFAAPALMAGNAGILKHASNVPA
jgi:succinate-semialdehyde dehydrogenase/glutarate-semialdehyde dehydrogenase